MSNAQKLYNMGVISLEECCDRMTLIRSITVVRDDPTDGKEESRNYGKNRLRTEAEFYESAWQRRIEVGFDILDRITVNSTGQPTKSGDITFNLRIHYGNKQLNWPGGHKREAIPGEKAKFRAVIDRINQAANNLK
jgi:hypothetical protein